MLSTEQIRLTSFDKSMRGYRTEEVDDFIAQVAATVDQLSIEKTDMEKKLFVMAEKVEEYRAQEETLKSTLINAQRLGENVIHEARQKADSMLHEAASKAQRMMDVAQEREREEKANLQRLEGEVAAFKGNILNLYQQHIESLTELDRQIKKTDTTIFGKREEEPSTEGAEDRPTTDAVDPLIENAASIVETYQAATFHQAEEE